MKLRHRTRWFVLCPLSFVLAAYAADVGGLMRQGNSLYNRGKYDEALSKYQMAEVLEPDATAIRYNLGNTLFRLGKYQEAVRELELVMIDKKPERRANAMYNIGNVAFKAGQLDPAIKAYSATLAINPNDKQAKENLEFCLKKKQEQQDQSDSSKQNQQQQQQQQQPQQGMDRNQAERVVQAVEDKEKEQQKKQRQAAGKRKVEQDW
ncbi:tetratricopeptide repeat protein [candidate division WOR-3 bacterium]|nr:tetratricopeptide repeat protein [candidate division WOR-3 bacterium]